MARQATCPDESAREIIRAYTQRNAEELYDLKNDPQEQHNLARDHEHVDRLVRMRHDLTAWMREQGDAETVFGTPELLPTVTP